MEQAFVYVKGRVPAVEGRLPGRNGCFGDGIAALRSQ